MHHLLFLFVAVCVTIKSTQCSFGDRSPYFQKCVNSCSLVNCTDDGLDFTEGRTHPVYLALLQWYCEDECVYECMWKTVDAFHERGWDTPQFYGKWPFVRIFGIQEPASTVFSLMNFYAHVAMLKKFRKEVKSDSPLYWLWHAFCVVCLNGWMCSTIFHTRDFPLTELLDYICAFLLVLMLCYCMVMRIVWRAPNFFKIIVTTFFVAFFANHATYLSMGNFSYKYNMQLNIILAACTTICWFAWSIYNRIRQPYVWKCAVFVSLTGTFGLLLEVWDMPPIFWLFDCHSLWHLTTAPLTCLFYSFLIDDCNYLRKITEVERGESTRKKVS